MCIDSFGTFWIGVRVCFQNERLTNSENSRVRSSAIAHRSVFFVSPVTRQINVSLSLTFVATIGANGRMHLVLSLKPFGCPRSSALDSLERIPPSLLNQRWRAEMRASP